MREQVYFSHGNGFPALCYKQFLDCLAVRFDCIYLDKIGHNDKFPVSDNWQTLVDELILSIKAQASEPVIAIGHSLGGVLNLLAAIKEPALFKSLILLDSPLIGRFKSSLVRFSKMLGMIDRITPAYQTKGRRERWDNREEVLSYLHSKKLFKFFTKVCLDDYIEYGLKFDESGYSLRFDPRVEYEIFRTIPHTLSHYEHQLKTPAALILGTQSKVVDRYDLHYMKKYFGIIQAETEGTHMFPMEHPLQVARLIFSILDGL